MKPIVIIPALNPDDRLISLVRELKRMDLMVIVVNDGSGPEYTNIFETLRSEFECDICCHPQNMGKGAALKTGIQFAAAKYADACGFVTCDADGQHTAQDVAKVGATLEKNPGKLVLGTRDFSEANIPLGSRWGNRITSCIFRFSTGKRCRDTQTGLRGIRRELTETCLAVPGNRYEYEMNLLLEMARQHVPYVFEPIATVYLEQNASSHFHPVKDSVIIYLSILKYSLSSLLSAVTDLTLFTMFTQLLFGAGSAGILAGTVIARVMSGGVNFTCNKYWVFQSKKPSTDEVLKYSTLFCVQMLASSALVFSLSSLPLDLTFIKALVDGSLFFISYQIQKHYIFHGQEKGGRSADERILGQAL